MKEHPLISIIIPCFNCESFVGEAIESALDQTYPNIEIIVVNDGSWDNSRAVIESFKDNITILWQENKGAGAARNNGLQWAKGEFVLFHDADDLLTPSMIRDCYYEFINDVGIVFCEFTRIFQKKRYFLIGKSEKNQNWDPSDPILSSIRCSIATSSILFRKSLILNSNSFREDMKTQQDMELLFRLVIKGVKVVKICKKLVKVREHNSPFRSRNQINSPLNSIKGQDELMYLANMKGVLTHELQKIFADRYARYGRQAYQAGFKEEARQAFNKALSLSAYPKSTEYSIYNFFSLLLGLENWEKVILETKRLLKKRLIFK